MTTLRAFILGLCLTVVATTAPAQTVSVQSGDHAGFTRLVARIGTERDWQITQTANRAQVTFSPDAPEFDVSNVFNLIDVTRLTAIHNDDGLTLELACACPVTIERYQDRFIIIDISDAPDPPDGPAVAELPAESEVTLPILAGRQTIPVLPEPTPAAPTPHIDPVEIHDTADINMDDAGTQVAEQLARATAAGLLEVAPGMSFAAGDPTTPEVPADQEPGEIAAVDHLPAIPSPDPAPALQISNAFDQHANIFPDRLTEAPTLNCVRPPLRPVSDWSDGMQFSNGLGALRVGVYDDRGQVVQDRALLLVEFYLVHGFGAEAAFWLSEMQRPHPFHDGLANFLEHETLGQLGTYDQRDSCADEMNFWLFLTAADAVEPDDIATPIILSEFFSLPATLRDLFGPYLARRLIELGDEATALEIRENLGRGGRLANETLTLLDLDLAEAAPQLNGHPPAPSAAPAHVSSVNAVSAMTHRLRAQINANGHANADDLMAAEALILETNPRPDLNGLVHITALAHALAGNLDPIMMHLSATMDQHASAAMPIFTDVVNILMDQGETAQLLILLSSPEFGQFGHFPSPAYRRRVATYFLNHGMPDLARDIIVAGGNDRPADREILTTAFDRISQDAALLAPEPNIEPPTAVANPASSAEEVIDLLTQSRETREAIAAMLTPMAPSS